MLYVQEAGVRAAFQTLATKSLSSLLPGLAWDAVQLHQPPSPVSRPSASSFPCENGSFKPVTVPFMKHVISSVSSTGSFFFLQGSGCQQRKRSCHCKQKLRYRLLVDPSSQHQQADASVCEMAFFLLSILLRSQATTWAKLLSPNCRWQKLHVQLILKEIELGNYVRIQRGVSGQGLSLQQYVALFQIKETYPVFPNR